MQSQIFARALAVFALLVATSSAGAQPAHEPAPAASDPAGALAPAAEAASDRACCIVAARTPVEIEIVDALNSRTARTRASFAFRLAEPLAVDGRVVAPAGTPGVGEVVHSAKAGAGGKAGELILAARYLELEGTRIPLRSLRYGRRQGTDNSGAVNTGGMVAAAVLPVASLVGFLISGGEVDIPAGTRAHAQTSAEIVLMPID